MPFYQKGISEVGHKEGSTDTSWGRTQQTGVTLQLAAQTVDLMSGQAYVMEESDIERVDMQLVIALVFSDLKYLQMLWGLPASALTGDLSAGTPTPEVLTIGATLGTQTRSLYSLGVGPRSTRRLDAPRCRAITFGDLVQASNAFNAPQSTWRILNPASGAPLTITDAV